MIQTWIDYNMTNIIMTATFAIGVISGLLIVEWWKVYHRKDEKEDKGNLVRFFDEDEEGWHTDNVPCPGSLICCVAWNNSLHFGYAVAYEGKAALLEIPGWLSEYRKRYGSIPLCCLTPAPIGLYKKWSYIERRILPSETLATYEELYRRQVMDDDGQEHYGGLHAP